MREKEFLKKFFDDLDGERIFLIDNVEGKQYTYCRFFDCVNCLAEEIGRLQCGQLIVVLENSALLCMLYFACALQNIMIIPVDPQKGAEEIDRICRSHPKAVKIGKENAGALHECLNDPLITKTQFLLSKLDQIDFEKGYLVTYTSGSTGTPKGVVHSIKNLIASARAFGELLSYSPADTLYHAMPMTYMAGILNTIVLPFIFGCKIVLGQRFSVMEAVKFWKYVDQYRINCFWMAPAMLRMILTVDKKRKGRDALPREKRICFSVGTAPLDDDLRQEFEDAYGIRLYQSYGLSETLFLTSQHAASPAGDCSVGCLLEGVRMELCPDGEAMFSVPWMFLGYWDGQADLQAPGEWYGTGDLVAGSSERLKICGRKKELIIKGGININPCDIEQQIKTVFGVSQCVVQGVPKQGDEQIVCWIPENDCPVLDRNTINMAIEQHLGTRYRLDALVRVSELPKNLNGKIDKLRLKREWRESAS